MLCQNSALKVKHGPIALNEANLMVMTNSRHLDDRKQPIEGGPMQHNMGNKVAMPSVTLTISRKPAIEKIGMRYLPIGKY